MTLLRTNQDIINNALFNAGEQTNANSDYFTKALDYYNRVYRSVLAGGSELAPGVNEAEWYWLKKQPPGSLILQPNITGTLTAVYGSQAATINAGANILNRYILFPNDVMDTYVITAQVGLNITLDTVFTGVSGTYAYKAALLDYALASDFGDMIGPMRVQRTGDEISGVPMQQLQQEWPTGNLCEGIPQVFSFIGTQQVHFSHAPQDTLRVDYDYNMLATDLQYDLAEPLLPVERRVILSDYVAMLILTDKDDQKANTYAAMALSGLTAMAADNRRKQERQGTRMGQLTPRQDLVGARRNGPYRSYGSPY